MDALNADSKPDSTQPLANSKPFSGPFLYHLSLWIIVLGTFVALDFAKELDELFPDSVMLEILANLLAPVVLIWLGAVVLSILWTLLDKTFGSRIEHFLAIFTFVTINLWSIRVGLSRFIYRQPAALRSLVGVILLALALLGTWFVSRRILVKISWLDRIKFKVIALCGISTIVFASACGLLGFYPIRPQASSSSRTPNIIMVTFDALSASHLKLYGYNKNTAPNIEQLARNSIVFDNFRTNYTVTPPALNALMGNFLYDESLEVRGQRPSLFKLLAKAYPNQGFFGYYSPYLYFGRRLPGEAIPRSGQNSLIYRIFSYVLPDDSIVYLGNLSSGELHTYWPYNSEWGDDIFWTTNHYPESISFSKAFEFLRQHPKGSFIWVHCWRPHYPYWPDHDVAEKFGVWYRTPVDLINRGYTDKDQPQIDQLKMRYDANIYSVDRSFGEFIAELKMSGLYDSSIIIVGSDHGESFGDGYVGHSGGIVTESISHIPMLIHLPGVTGETRVSAMASQIDLAPTLLELLGLPIPAELPGKSLVSYIKNTKLSDHRVHITVSYSAFNGSGGEIVLYKGDYKLIYYSTNINMVRLYDIKNDPKLKVNIASTHQDVVRQIMEEAGAW